MDRSGIKVIWHGQSFKFQISDSNGPQCKLHYLLFPKNVGKILLQCAFVVISTNFPTHQKRKKYKHKYKYKFSRAKSFLNFVFFFFVRKTQPWNRIISLIIQTSRLWIMILHREKQIVKEISIYCSKLKN